MTEALEDAGVQSDQLTHLNAHGSSMVGEDAAEAQAINKVLGQIPVVAHKGNFGDLGPGCSIIELAASVKSLHEKCIASESELRNAGSGLPGDG